ncbi:uncharacterized protein LOC9635747 [Selaginella moellendorffii]|uniref:uncharacterized protein LOC9635747 n=1 Tax=Selaginella moellendorffii TaxID=88036 RepID=UPI000D1C87EC|nr:uncharacterized protein LOC9635747 [Selaginella moellendorffii]XP_024528117.1 uncharacterized protein LOC9635747 [Selaginella moellendorffii]XP_024528119.1 uncharacterized protein LOC9635747 [Selaginella moellendorffii]XP_024528120.1 uncharacterized protein LOC9635747 [Selaginella moellendorffii]|eukprot:XP_024528116.1 uncharacterized protein LOC9635747 [Selaginella moellendorffii]
MSAVLSRRTTPVRGLSLKDCDPERLVAPSSCILDGSFESPSSSSDEDCEISVPGDDSSSALRLPYTPPRKKWEVSVKNGIVTTKEVSVDEEISQFSGDEEEEVNDFSEDAYLCEAVLRSVFAVSSPARSLDDRLADAETVTGAFSTIDRAMLHSVKLRAQKAAQYRRAELSLWLDALQNNQLQSVNLDQFEDPQIYERWKQQQMQEVSTLIAKLGERPSFSGFVQVDVVSVDNLKPLEVGCVSPLSCSREALKQLHVYSSVTVLPMRSGSEKFGTGDLGKEPTPAFLTDVVPSTGNAEWQAASPWIRVSSVQDKVLIEVWDRQIGGSSFRASGKSKLKKVLRSRSSSRSLKVAPWNQDPFLGQVIVSFSNIESQALSQGVMQGKTPLMSYMLADEKGRQKTSGIQLRFSCSCERFYRDAPSNKLLLRPPVPDVEKAFDALVSMAYKPQKKGNVDVAAQWHGIVAGFGFHYRIRKQRCSLGIVMVLARNFHINVHILSSIVEEWLPVCDSARGGQLTKDELGLHTAVVSMLVKPAIDAIENFQTVFAQNQPSGALSCLLKLLGLVLRWDPDPKEILIPLKSWIKNSCEKRFYHHLFGGISSTQQPTEISLQHLSNVIKLVHGDVTELRTSFKDTFPEAVSLTAVAVPVYYKLVSAYVINCIRVAQVKMFTKDCESLIMEMLSFHKDIELAGEKCELLDLHGIFGDHINQLISTARTRMVDWVSSSITAEKWEPLSAQSGALFSFSVVDLYFMLGEVMDEMMTRLATLPFGNFYFKNVEDAICTAVRTYVELLEKLCLRDLPEETTAEGISSSELSISKALCVKLNNMNAVMEQHQDLERRLMETQRNSNGREPLETDADANNLSLFKILERHGSVKDGLNPKFEEIQRFTEQTIDNVVGSVVELLQVRIGRDLHLIFDEAAISDGETLDQNLQPLTGHLDQHLMVMNDSSHPVVFQKLITEICKALVFCLEEFALNRDEDPNPMTPKQRRLLEESLSFFYDYFYGDGQGLDGGQMDTITARLRQILACWDLDTRELCSLYWRAWDQFNTQEENRQPEVDGNSGTLHILDYLWLLKQRTDDEAHEIVEQQNFIANKRMMQFMFGLPKEEELVASYSCRNPQKVRGTLYVTPKHICFADTKMTLADSRNLYVVPIDRMMRIELSGKRSIVLIPFHQRPLEFSKLSDRDAVCKTIFDQVVGTGSHLEKCMSPIWSEKGRHAPLKSSNSAVKVFKCWRQGMLHKYSGTLLVTTAYILFTQDDKQKVIQMDHTSISKIHASRRGLRPSGVVIELKSGEDCEFCDFEGYTAPAKEIAKDLHSLVFPG